MPYLLSLVGILLLFTYVPDILMFLPNLVNGSAGADMEIVAECIWLCATDFENSATKSGDR